MTADKYIASIRNPDKKAYAELYWAWLSSGKKGIEPSRGSLSFMAAQAVRLTLYDALAATWWEMLSHG